ncbi:MAG TPA: hypothetical protein VNL14_03000 [Candidatus Acidoferrales bacterium]|nr:hypothetical protein [Candidatus Acidoferrales bacterium]
MAQEDIERSVESQRRALLAVWAAMMASLVLYLAIPLLLPSGRPLPRPGWELLLRTVFWFVAVAEVLFLMWWKERHLRPAPLLAGAVSESDIARALSRGVANRIIALAVAESVAIYGLVLALIGHAQWDQYVFTLVSAVLLIQLYPSSGAFEEFIERARRRAI